MFAYFQFTIQQKKDYLTIEVSERAGKWAYGYMCFFTPFHGGVGSPGAGGAASGISHRYGDKFNSKSEAILGALLHCKKFFGKPDFRLLVDKEISKYRTLQLPLFQ